MDNTRIAKENLRKVREFLAERGLGALVVSRQHNLFWLTGGGDCHVGLATQDAAARLVVTADEAYIITKNIELPRLLAEEVDPNLFQVRAFDWYEGDFDPIIKELVGDLPLGSDMPGAETVFLESELGLLRSLYSEGEQERLLIAGQRLGEALGQVCREVVPGETEFAVAGRLTSALLARELTPTVLLVGADERIAKFRHPIPTQKVVTKYAMVACVARYKGIQVAGSRLVHFGPLDADLLRKHQAVVTVDATLIGQSVPGRKLNEILAAGIAAYREAGFAEEWKLHHQGGIIGYWTREMIATPQTQLTLRENQALAWNPSITGTKSEDTILVTKDGPQVVTSTPDWPMLEVHTVDGIFYRPDILVR